jgi:SAM-dependent methyltransferase
MALIRDAAARYRRFWHEVGTTFPDLGPALSTDFYRANEQRLFTEHLAPLAGISVLKTDLWDEARNTRILQWAASQGAVTYGIDISRPTVALVRASAGGAAIHAATGDVRAIPFADNTFDAIYSMGTIEHFDETETAVAEMFRVLKPGGRAIIGVPNRYDPFLRAPMVAVMQAFGIYSYGFEKSYSRAMLRRMLQRAGFIVSAETAILFIPGWLRMLDLACHAWCRPLTPLTSAMVRPFIWLDEHVPAVRRHGYLLVTVVEKAPRQ